MTAIPRPRAAIIGPGRLGSLIAISLRTAGYRVAAIAGGTDLSRRALADTLGGTHTYDVLSEALAAAELVILTVPDRFLTETVTALAKADAFTPAHKVVHVSGAYGTEVLELARKAGSEVAALHPAVSVPQIVTDPDVLTNVAWAVTAKAHHVAFAVALVEDLGGTAYLVQNDRRVLYHAALTLASNATAAAIVNARRLLAAAGIDTPDPFLLPLATQSVGFAVRDGVAGVSGPVVRGDVETLRKHHDALAGDVPSVLPAYDRFVEGIVHTVVTANPAVDQDVLFTHIGAPRVPEKPVVVQDAAVLRDTVRAHQRQGLRVVLVPTMGALHDGHLALVREAKRHGDVVVVSIFVNPTQFDDPDDLAAYPRTLDHDFAKLVDLQDDAPAYVFVPDLAAVYPNGTPKTQVVVAGVTERLCGAHRPGHFAGVATIVTKLFTLTGCDVAVFGQKDFQQTAVIRQMVADLNLPVSIVVAPTVREYDGLALSSRNVRLDVDARKTALALSRALAAACVEARKSRGPVPVAACVAAATRVLDEFAAFRRDYVEAVDPVTLQPVSETSGTVLLAVAGHVGDVRLIDNVLLGDRDDEQRVIDAVFAGG